MKYQEFAILIENLIITSNNLIVIFIERSKSHSHKDQGKLLIDPAEQETGFLTVTLKFTTVDSRQASIDLQLYTVLKWRNLQFQIQ